MTQRPIYTHGHHDAVLRSHRWRTAENSAAYLLPHLTPGLSILDVGCGPGTITADLAAIVAPGQVLGIDVAPEVVDQASALATDNLTFQVGDVFTSEGTWDVVHAHQVLQHLTDPVRALHCMRDLAPLVAARDSDYSGMMWAPRDTRLDLWMEIYQRVTRTNDAEPDAGRFLLAWARAAGFSDVTYTTSTWTFWTDADRAWWGELWAERITSSALAEQAMDYGIASREDLRDVAAGWRAWAATPGAVFVVPHGEILARR